MESKRKRPRTLTTPGWTGLRIIPRTLVGNCIAQTYGMRYNNLHDY